MKNASLLFLFLGVSFLQVQGIDDAYTFGCLWIFRTINFYYIGRTLGVWMLLKRINEVE